MGWGDVIGKNYWCPNGMEKCFRDITREINLVSGEMEYKHGWQSDLKECAKERYSTDILHTEMNLVCGKEGKFFEAKEGKN